MNKTMEYLSYELPVVAFDLLETRIPPGGGSTTRSGASRCPWRAGD
jgi:hypothetical protein